jgi:molybdenum cofactor cytidylyltransferase
LLAAGKSSRYKGANKLLLPFADSTVIRVSAERLLQAVDAPLIVITGHQVEHVTAALNGLPVRFVHNDNYAEGEMSSSIKCGLRAAEALPDVLAALVALGDMPMLPIDIVRQICAEHQKLTKPIIAPRFQSLRGHPVLLDRAYWQEALALRDGAPMRELLERHPDNTHLIDVDTDLILRDVDTPELYAQALLLDQ